VRERGNSVSSCSSSRVQLVGGQAAREMVAKSDFPIDEEPEPLAEAFRVA
jgi:hypothetical protein